MKENLFTTGTVFTDNYDEENTLYACSECGEMFEEDDIIIFEGRAYCKECFEDCTAVCDCCGERVPVDLTESDSEITICCYCADECYHRCSECDSLVYDSKVHTDEFDNYLCPDCWEHIHGNDAIHEFSYKPKPIFHNENNEKGSLRYFGTELEVDRRSQLSIAETDETVRALLDGVNGDIRENKLYSKTDSSLKHGFELVSHPMTLAFHLNSMPWEKIMRYLIENGYISNSSETCGLHIHVNKSSLGDTEEERNDVISNILMFVENNWDEILKFSRRTEAQMNRWAARYGIKEHEKLKEIAKDKNTASRYTCVNLQNSDTVEFRMFKGTLNYTVFAAALQFVNAVCSIAKECTCEKIKTMNWAEFISNLDKKENDKKENKELFSYLREKKLLF